RSKRDWSSDVCSSDLRVRPAWAIKCAERHFQKQCCLLSRWFQFSHFTTVFKHSQYWLIHLGTLLNAQRDADNRLKESKRKRGCGDSVVTTAPLDRKSVV